jgi:hypothetical protein
MMRRIKWARGTGLVFLVISTALSACSVTAAQLAPPPSGYCAPAYAVDPVCAGATPWDGDFAFDDGWGFGWYGHDHLGRAHFGGHDFGHRGFAHGGLPHGGFGHGGFAHGGGGHGGGGHGR